MTASRKHPPSAGFSLIELMVVIAIIALGVTLAVPYFGGAATTARERSIVDRMVQDFNWARAAAGVADASTLGGGYAAGKPSITVKLWDQATGKCGWTVFVNGTVDSAHSSNDSSGVNSLASQAPGITCGVATDTLPLPVTFTVSSQGFIDKTGTISYSSTQSGSTANSFWPLLFLSSGSILNTHAAS